ncbi:hypothetical protein BCR43DRAFT_511209 [Syncephalastrum racemosum]|uniref:Uncharacterized protein n=1 Tax=Syncephalastrum racemosum TaxID=13706 RepID=A0A1X2HMR6_SYNRA|nr:hypothetical protein BCR43DRAFT_511209 [Syncephalastrum racemosum]
MLQHDTDIVSHATTAEDSHIPFTLVRRMDGSNFSTATHQTTTFKVVHVIAAVFGAAVIGIAVFLMYRKRQRRRQQSNQEMQQAHIHPSTTTAAPYYSGALRNDYLQFSELYGHDAQIALPERTKALYDGRRVTSDDEEANTGMHSVSSPAIQQNELQCRLWQHQHMAASSCSISHPARPPPPYHP